ncbi:MAG: US12 family protein [Planctomycetaceae bacterium]|nr:US12 family protein [Planctomycetaceae bacterium]
MSYADEFASSSPFAIDAVREERAAFIRRTYAHLAGAICVFAGLLYIISNNDALVFPLLKLMGVANGFLFLGMFIGASWIANSWAMNGKSLTTQYMGLALYTVAEAIIFAPVCYFVSTMIGTPELLFQAAGLTLVVFGGLTAFVMITGADFSFMRGFLVVGSLVAFAALIFGAISGFHMGLWFSVAMIGLSAGYILYDTSNVMRHYRTDQHVAAALALFASVALMFWYMIQLLLALQGRD